VRPPAGVGPVEQGAGEADERCVVETGKQMREPDEAAITAITRGSPNRSSGACWPSMADGRASTKVSTSSAGRASVACASHRRWLAASPTVRRAFQFSAVRRPIAKSRVLQTTVSVRGRPMLLEILCDPAQPVVAIDLWIDTCGDDFGAQRPRSAVGDPPIDDQRH
jgi:hypothetical protein